MRNTVYAVLIALTAFGSGVWWARHVDRAPVAVTVPQRVSQPEVVRQGEPSAATRVPTNVEVSRAKIPEPAMTHEPLPRAEFAAATAGRRDAPPIDISPGFEAVLAPTSEVAADRDNPAGIPVRQHLKLQMENRDRSWADRVESDIRAQVRNELMAQGADPQRIELPVVECRTSGCEVQAIGYPEDAVKNRDFQLILPKVMRDAMGADFDSRGLTMMVTSVPDGRMGYIAFLSRRSRQ
jgi:hypothetical protein